MQTMRERAFEWVEKQIRKTRISIGHAEQKPNASLDEIQNLYGTLDILEYISQKVLGAREEAEQTINYAPVLIESKAPKCPGCGRAMELFQIAAGGWRYGCLACATSFKSIKRKQYGWISPIKSTKERAYAAASLATEPKWISVKDRLPESDQKVLAYTSEGKGTFEEFRLCCGWAIKGAITHWMPLPEPPKEE